MNEETRKRREWLEELIAHWSAQKFGDDTTERWLLFANLELDKTFDADQLAPKIEDLEDQIHDLQEEISDSADEIQKLTDKVDDLKIEREELEKEIKEADQENFKLKTRIRQLEGAL